MKVLEIIINIAKKKLLFLFFLLHFFLWSCGTSEQNNSAPSSNPAPQNNLLPFHYVLGNELFAFQSFDKAVEEYEKVLEIDPYYLPAIQNLANSYLKLKNHKQAIKNWKKLLAILNDERKKVDIYFNLGIASFEDKKRENAIFYTFKALQLSIQYGNRRINAFAKDNLRSFKEFYKLTDQELIDIVKNFKET